MTQKHTLILLIFVAFGASLFAQTINEPKDVNAQWTEPYPPFKIVGNVYYVGTYDLACYLITTPKGHFLINTGLASSATSILDNIKSLGFQPADVKILLTTQAHYDHVAALAEIQKRTGSQIMADEKDVTALEDGGSSDYELGKYGMTFQPVKVDRKLHDHESIELGGTRLTMLHHPGHTKGSCSYLLDVADGTKMYRVLIANLPSIITDRKFSEVAAYPEIARDYRYTLDALRKIPFDLWLSSHASQFGLHSKHTPDGAYNPEAFRDRSGYNKAIDDLEAAYQRKMAQE